MIISVTPLWYHLIPFFGDHYNIIFYSYQWCHISLSCTIYLQSSVITYHSDLILCYYCTICSLPFNMGSFLGLFCPLLIVSSTWTNNTLDVYKLDPYDPKYEALNSYNWVIAPQSTCKSIKHQVSVLPHWFIPSLLPLHLVETSNSNISNPPTPNHLPWHHHVKHHMVPVWQWLSSATTTSGSTFWRQ